MTDEKEQRIAEIRERERKATKGPWLAENKPSEITLNLDAMLNSGSLRVSAEACTSRYGLIPQGVVWYGDAEFIAHARADIPFLLEQLAAQSAPVEEVARKIAEKNCEHFADFCRAEYVERFTKEIAEQLRQHRYGAQAELGQALGNVLKKIGVINDIPLTGPELLLAAETYCNGAQWQGVGPKCPKSREEICSWTRKWFSDHRPANREDFDLADMLADFAQFFSPVPSPESATSQHGICPNCGADRSGPSAEASSAWPSDLPANGMGAMNLITNFWTGDLKGLTKEGARIVDSLVAHVAMGIRAELETAQRYGRTEYGIEQKLRKDLESLREQLADKERMIRVCENAFKLQDAFTIEGRAGQFNGLQIAKAWLALELRAESAEAQLATALEALRKLIADKEPNGYPLWFNRTVRTCKLCDSEDLCTLHHQMAGRDFTDCEEEIDEFMAELGAV